MFHSLPNEIQMLIYQFDPTYRIAFNRSIQQIHTYGYKKRIRKNIHSPCLKRNDMIGHYIVSFST